MKPLAVALVSGGMDSCVAAAVAEREFRLFLLHIRYGQRTELKELDCFQRIADHYRPEKNLILRLDYLSVIGGSSLTDVTVPVPESDPNRTDIPSTYVPFRNAGFLAAAVSWAEVTGAEAVFIGAVEEDSSGYPDCRESFFSAFQGAVRTGTRTGHVNIRTPLLHMTKAEIVRLGISLNAPLHHTWSCYRRMDAACGTCASCVLRIRGFEGAGIKDPIQYLDHLTPDGSAMSPSRIIQ